MGIIRDFLFIKIIIEGNKRIVSQAPTGNVFECETCGKVKRQSAKLHLLNVKKFLLSLLLWRI